MKQFNTYLIEKLKVSAKSLDIDATYEVYKYLFKVSNKYNHSLRVYFLSIYFHISSYYYSLYLIPNSLNAKAYISVHSSITFVVGFPAPCPA